MDYKEKIDWIRLIRSDGIGNVIFHKLLAKYKTPTKVIEFLESSGKTQIQSIDLAEKEIESAEKNGVIMLFSNDTDYPTLLKQTTDYPAILYVLGNTKALSNKSIGVVGSRNASINSKNMTAELSKEFVDNNYTVISGMAIGIDTQAHIGALSSKNIEGCQTIAVLAGGVDNIYPYTNTNLYHSIVENGAVISEMPIGTEPQANLFPRRNRIISGLSKGTLVIEANIKSGSLITARFAIEQNRELFAIPNFPRDPRASGANMLIKNGAHLTESSADVISVLNELPDDIPTKDSLFSCVCETALDYLPHGEIEFDNLDIQNKILSLLSHSPISLDSLTRELENFNHSQLSNALLCLELEEKISYPSTGKIILKL